MIRSYATAHPEIALIELHDTICADGYVEEIDGVPLRDDGLHLNAAGAALVWQRIDPVLIDAVEPLAGAEQASAQSVNGWSSGSAPD